MCLCSEPVSVTVKCAGKGLAAKARRTVAAVNVPCPTCGSINQLYFEPSGTVHAVAPVPGPTAAARAVAELGTDHGRTGI